MIISTIIIYNKHAVASYLPRFRRHRGPRRSLFNSVDVSQLSAARVFEKTYHMPIS